MTAKDAQRIALAKRAGVPLPKPTPTLAPRPPQTLLQKANGQSTWRPTDFAAKHGPIPPVKAIKAGSVTTIPKPGPRKGG